MPIIHECFNFLKENASGQWHETFRFKNKETDEYLHAIQRGMLLLRVETTTKRAFYWLYNIDDAIRFNEFVGLQLKAEAHEIILTPRIRLFFDIDLILDEFKKYEFADHYRLNLDKKCESETMDNIGKSLAVVFKEATLISLEENGIDLEADLVGFDYFYTMRNRSLDEERFKISIHLITNLMLPLRACSAIVAHIKSDVINSNTEILGINDDMVDLLIGSIDETQYRRHGSLSLPYGKKSTSNGIYTNWIYRDYSIPNQRFFITLEDHFTIHDIDLGGYNISDSSTYSGTEACPEFVKEALKHVGNIKDYNSRVWDINGSILKRSTMYVKRCASSMCSACNRTHDNDNTLFLIFNSDRGLASWKCARMPDMKPIEFYRREETFQDDDDAIEAFKSKHTKSNKIKQPKIDTSALKEPEFKYKVDDIELFSSKHSKLKVVQSEDVFDPFERAPRKPKNSFIRRNPLPPKVEKDNIIPTYEEYSDEDESKEEPERKRINKRIGNGSRIIDRTTLEY